MQAEKPDVMNKFEKLLLKILWGQNDANIDFLELKGLLFKLGFKERIKGSHHIYSKDNIEEIINIQPIGKLAKPYQVKQIRQIIVKYSLGGIYGK